MKPLFRQEGNGGRTFGGPNRISVRSGPPVGIADSILRASFQVGEGETVGFAMRWAPTEDADPVRPTHPDRVAERIDDVIEA